MTSVNLAPSVRRMVRFAARGNSEQVQKNLSMLGQVAAALPVPNPLLTGGIRNLGDIILAVQRQQKEAPGAVPKLKDPTLRDLTRDFEGQVVSARYKASRDFSGVVHPEGKYSSGEGPCTLCTETVNLNFPGLLAFWWTDFALWPNPSPIFDDHITFAREEHLPQNLSRRSVENMFDFLWLAPQFRIFYNGPAVGASVPKHQHFQGIVDPLPVEKLARSFGHKVNNTAVGTINNFPARVVVLEGRDYEEIAGMAERLARGIEQLVLGQKEGVIDLNALFAIEGDYYRAFLFPRRKIAPSPPFDQINKTPAAVELSGMMVTGNRTEFDGLSAEAIAAVLDEISVSSATLMSLMRAEFGIGLGQW